MTALARIPTCCENRTYTRIMLDLFDRSLTCMTCGSNDARWTAPCKCGSGRQVPICLGCCKQLGIEDVKAVLHTRRMS